MLRERETHLGWFLARCAMAGMGFRLISARRGLWDRAFVLLFGSISHIITADSSRNKGFASVSR